MGGSTIVIGGAAGVAIILLIIFIIAGYESIEVGSYGLDYNTLREKVDTTTVYKPGLYFLGLTHKFIEFPSTLISVDLEEGLREGALVARTQDGLLVKLELSFQYGIPELSVPLIFGDYLTNYHPIIRSLARDALRDVCSNYTALQFNQARTTVSEQMRTHLAEILTAVNVQLNDFQLNKVDLPDSFEDAVEEAEVARQDIEKATNERVAAEIEAETLRLTALSAASIRIVEANATAQSFLFQEKAVAFGISTLGKAKTDAQKNLKTELGFSNDELLQYLYTEMLMDKKETTLMTDLNAQPIVNV